MQTSTLFIVGLLVGALVVFGVRAATLDAPDTDSKAGEPPAGHDHGAVPETATRATAAPVGSAAPAPKESAVIEVVLDDDGQIQSATMRMSGGTQHVVEPGGHAPMGDYPARVLGRSDGYTAHLHAHSAHRLELTIMDDEGDLVATRVYEHTRTVAPSSEAPAGRPSGPENRRCPVMGNPVDPGVYIDYQGRRIGFCCPGCDEAFLANPAKYLKIIDKEIAARGEDK